MPRKPPSNPAQQAEEPVGTSRLQVSHPASGSLAQAAEVLGAGRTAWLGELVLDGYYAPPGGGMGVIADRLLLNVAARATGRRLLERIAEVMAA